MSFFNYFSICETYCTLGFFIIHKKSYLILQIR